MKTIVEVVAAVIYQSDTIFCARRPAGGEAGLRWEFPGGKVEAHESHQQALIREIDEELSLTIIPGQFIHCINRTIGQKVLAINFYWCTIRSGSLKLNEHIDFCWLKKENLKSLDWAIADQALVEILIT